MQNVVFAVPFVMESSVRFVRAAAMLDGVRLAVVSQDPVEKLPLEVRNALAGFVHAAPQQLLAFACAVEFGPQPAVFVGQAARRRDEALELVLEAFEFRIHGPMVGSERRRVKPASAPVGGAACDSIAR